MTVEEVEKRIKKEIPVGSTKAQVIAFLDSLRIDSLETVRGHYIEELEGLRYDNFDDKPEKLKGRLKGFLGAAIFDVEHDPFVTYHIAMRFYFGKDGRLIDYTVKKELSLR